MLDALVERLAGLIEPGDYAPEDMENDRIATTIRPQLDEWTDGAASEAMLAERLAIVANRLLERGANEAWPPIVELVIGLVVLTWGILTRDPPEDDAEAITGAATKADVPMIEDPDAEGSA